MLALACMFAGCGGADTPHSPAFEEQAVSPEAKAEPSASQETDPRPRVYREAMNAMADDIIAKTRKGAATEFESYEDAKAALEAALPQQSLSKIDEALLEASISTEDMTAFMRDNPEFVQEVGAEFSQRLSEVEPQLAQLIAKVAALAPPDEREQVVEMLDGLGYAHLLDAPQWTAIKTVEDLQVLAATAAKESKPLLLDVWATWCTPCRELDDKTLSDPAVAKLLGKSFATAKFDVTEPDAAAERFQTSLGASSLPALLVWKDPGELSETLRKRVDAGKPVAKPDLEIRVFVEPGELLPKLTGIAGTDSAAG